MAKSIRPKDLKRRMESGSPVSVVDVRTRFEFRAGHIPGAVNYPLGTFQDRIDALLDAEEVVVVCRSGARSSLACESLKSGHASVLNLEGGTEGWSMAGFDIERTKVEPMNITRQTHLVAGLMLVTALALAVLVDPRWMFLAGLPAFGLILDALTGVCPMTLILKKMPWNAGSGGKS